MLYIVCPTCGRLLADKMIPYENGVRKIDENDELDADQKNEEKMKLLDKLKIPQDRYCCRMRLITYKSLVHIVK